MIPKWVFDSVNARVILEDDSEAIFYTDTLSCSDSVIERVVEIHNNSKQESLDLLDSTEQYLLPEIKQYLIDETNCNEDDKDYLIEAIFNYYQVKWFCL